MKTNQMNTERAQNETVREELMRTDGCRTADMILFGKRIEPFVDNYLIAKTENNLQEVSSRGGRLILLGDSEMKGCDIIPCNSLQGIFSPFAASPLFQLYAYYTALLRGCDPDMPRNLAKSVTVE